MTDSLSFTLVLFQGPEQASCWVRALTAVYSSILVELRSQASHQSGQGNVQTEFKAMSRVQPLHLPLCGDQCKLTPSTSQQFKLSVVRDKQTGVDHLIATCPNHMGHICDQPSYNSHLEPCPHPGLGLSSAPWHSTAVGYRRTPAKAKVPVMKSRKGR